jgi:hypothetical protein
MVSDIPLAFDGAKYAVAPFVGHNAFLRWSALQECAQVDKEDGIARVWSESHVSEDFQIALSLQSNGWMLRWATYSNMQFEEGVSLSAIDELARWEKYSYGCSYVYPSFSCSIADMLVRSFSTLSDFGSPGVVHFPSSFEHSCGLLFHLMPSGVSWLTCSHTMPYLYPGSLL